MRSWMADTAFHQFAKWRRLWQEKRCSLLLFWSAHKFFSFSPRLGIVSPVTHFLFIRQTLLETLQLQCCIWVFTKEPEKHQLLSYSTVYTMTNAICMEETSCLAASSLPWASWLGATWTPLPQLLWSLTLSREEQKPREHLQWLTAQSSSDFV